MKEPQNTPELNRRLAIQIVAAFMLLVVISVSAHRAFNRSSNQFLSSVSSMERLGKVVVIPLSGEIKERKTEISGMSWYGDYLILLPQYPNRIDKTKNGKLFAIHKSEILAFLDGESSVPLTTVEIPIDSQIFINLVNGFEGFEAIAFYGEQAFLTIEASNPMRGYLATGILDPGLKLLDMDTKIVEIQPQSKIQNFSDEGLIIFKDRIYTFYEANGINDNPQPVVHIFNFKLEPLEPLPMPNVEYRLTDASSPDESGNFWVLNYFFWGDLMKIHPGSDQLSQDGDNTSFMPPPIERLVELKVTTQGIIIGDDEPIRLSLAENGAARNWEALAALDERGFLIATDKFPETILAFISR